MRIIMMIFLKHIKIWKFKYSVFNWDYEDQSIFAYFYLNYWFWWFIFHYLCLLKDGCWYFVIDSDFVFESLGNTDGFRYRFSLTEKSNELSCILCPLCMGLLSIFLNFFVFNIEVFLFIKIWDLFDNDACKFAELFLLDLFWLLFILLLLLGCFLLFFTEFNLRILRRFVFWLHNFYNYNVTNRWFWEKVEVNGWTDVKRIN